MGQSRSKVRKTEVVEFYQHERAPQLTVENFDDGRPPRYRMTAVVSEGDFVNGNNRMYPLDLLWSAFGAAQQKGVVSGTLDHPEYGEGSLRDTALVWERFWMEGKQIVGEARVTATSAGRDLIGLLESDYPLGFSTRGYGSFRDEVRDGQTVRIAESYELRGIDAVDDPSVSSARLRSYTKEQREMEDQVQELQTALESANAERVAATSSLTLANEALAASQERVTALEGQLATALAELEGLRTKVTEFEAVAAEAEQLRTQQALEAKLASLASGHPFGQAIVRAAREFGGLSLENAEEQFSRFRTLIESFAIQNPTQPRGVVADPSDAPASDEKFTPEEIETQRLAGLR